MFAGFVLGGNQHRQPAGIARLRGPPAAFAGRGSVIVGSPGRFDAQGGAGVTRRRKGAKASFAEILRKTLVGPHQPTYFPTREHRACLTSQADVQRQVHRHADTMVPSTLRCQTKPDRDPPRRRTGARPARSEPVALRHHRSSDHHGRQCGDGRVLQAACAQCGRLQGLLEKKKNPRVMA